MGDGGPSTGSCGAVLPVAAPDTPPPPVFALKQEPAVKQEDSELVDGDTEFRLYMPAKGRATKWSDNTLICVEVEGYLLYLCSLLSIL